MFEPDFTNLTKLPDHPAARVLATNKVKLTTPIDAPASASIVEVLRELHAKGAVADLLQLLAHALPPREATWWACISARDIADPEKLTPSIKAAEAWVMQPGFKTRAAARHALDTAPNDDDTQFCAMAACMADGTLGPAELDDYDAPPGAVGHAVFGMALISHFAPEDGAEARGQWLLARALNIASGGNGRVDEPNAAKQALTDEGETET